MFKTNRFQLTKKNYKMSEVQFIGVSISELAHAISEIIIPNFKTEVLEKAKQEQQTEFLTSTEACSMLKIGRTTLWRWQNKGIIKAYPIGGKSLFKREELLNTVENKES